MARPGFLGLHLGLVYLFLYGPILLLMILSLNESGLPTSWSGLSFRWYEALAENTAIQRAALNSLIVALVSTLIATTLGTLLALGVERRRGSAGLDALLFAPMVIPDIVLAIALLSFYYILSFSLGLYSIVLSHVVFNIAFACAVVRARLKHFDWAMLEASEDLGASAITTFARVTLPAILPGVIAAALLAFTLSIDEFIIAFFTAGPGQSSTTLPMQVYSMIRFGVTPEINALATLFLLTSFTLVLLAQRFGGRRGQLL
ncbi:MAG: ABC transporter permease [Rhodospirillales bacterium]